MKFIALALLASLVTACATTPPPKHINFVACPMVRDTSTVPCWLAEYEGETYFLTIQTDVSAPVTPPWLGHRVLVEGVITDEPRICGGVVLKPVSLSVMQELDGSCNTMLPAEDRYNLAFEPPRPPGPSKGRLSFGDPNTKPAALALPHTFQLQYEFDGMVAFRHAQTLQKILELVHETRAKQISITGYRAGSLLSNGQRMLEQADIGERRAEQVVELLKGAGLTHVSYETRWEDVTNLANGADDASRRITEVIVR
ncbi:MAG TPA: hypothetical protein VFS47_09225 [Steroidobacteraceae bacterium]|nr:hypothetical protein [Steroidobacteraceae bacterium]